MGGVRQIGSKQLGRWAVVLLGWLVLWFLAASSVWAAKAAPQTLTVDLLKQRIENPVNRDGKPAIDLRQMTIDLTASGELQADFYRLLRPKLQSNTAPALDLSYATIRGDLDLQQLGLREPLYGDALFPLLSEAAQAQLKRDRQRLTQLSMLSRSLLIQSEGSAQQIYLMRGPLILAQTQFLGQLLGTDIFFLDRLLAQGARFEQGVYLTGARFNRDVVLRGAYFGGALQLRNSIFFGRARLGQTIFQGSVNFQGAQFKADTNFNQSTFAADVNFSRGQWMANADFARTIWQAGVSFVKGTFTKALFFTEARFDAPVILRQARFGELVNLRNVILGNQLDFGDATFLNGAYINVSGMEFIAGQSEILGNPGQIGRVISVPVLAGNETLLRNLARNFRQLEQIADANQIEFLAERLRLKDWQQQLVGVNINTAPLPKLVKTGFTQTQAQAIAERRQRQPFLSAADLLDVSGVDLAAYVKVRDRILTRPPLSLGERIQLSLRWMGLSGLIVLSHYGTSVRLLLSLGLLAIAVFAILFWWVDRYRRRLPSPILPPTEEAIWMGSSCATIMAIGLSTLMRLGRYPLWSLVWLILLVLPIPALLIGRLLQQGRFHDLIRESYFVEDGSMRQLRLLIARLPIIPKFPFFRDRYTPLLWDRRWNWLNYYDFSVNNWLKFGFNDIRLRDQQVPGLVTALVWYQWGLGLLYVALLLWTLSRTIPGLNLLLYF